MNPFELTGSQFLVLYSLIGVMLVGGLALYRYMSAPAGGGQVALSDPYAIACLRRGKPEMLHLATLVLIERGLLTLNGQRVVREKDRPGEKTSNPLEVTLLEEFQRSSLPANVYASQPVEAQCRRYAQSLVEQGAWISDEDDRSIVVYRWLVIAALLVAAGLRAGAAISQGQSSLLLLVAPAVAFSLGAWSIHRHRRTARGSQFLRHLRTLLERSRADKNSDTNVDKDELAMLGAVLGVTALPALLQSHSASLLEAETGERERDGARLRVGAEAAAWEENGGWGRDENRWRI